MKQISAVARHIVNRRTAINQYYRTSYFGQLARATYPRGVQS